MGLSINDRFLNELDNRFLREADPSRAAQMGKYMKNLFPFLGIPSPVRKELCSPLSKNLRPDRNTLVFLVEKLWNREQREYQYTAMELAYRFRKVFKQEDIDFFEKLITTKSWWDTIDFLAAKLAGSHFIRFPEAIPPSNRKWMDSGNIWLQRTCLLFQLKYRQSTNTVLLEQNILACADSPEFFLRKAIGWVLREYSKTNPLWVSDFVGKHKLSTLSKREALKIISKKAP